MSTYATTAQDDCEVIETTDVWSGPFAETDKYGSLTGDHYYKCRDCGREVLEGIPRENVSHRDGCKHE